MHIKYKIAKNKNIEHSFLQTIHSKFRKTPHNNICLFIYLFINLLIIKKNHKKKSKVKQKLSADFGKDTTG